ncbi:phosphonate metabolism protein/1,5-bisphosphokinase (PRPP-forming) PhnN [Microbacterium sp. G2-8]|uniref:phosphonate metabolism protein/1,5-bisphosphokinase (PRPP-forming) PhnN n=1 Tax=Microbacterium sp. G2-8 TaxID=2842454 RepID=UPI001C8A89AC|nr:phosphonate metabolism protein/1,5-bisphosphokinase (PRPP-forming) PhnN [Microbacterium sp. G2-8]
MTGAFVAVVGPSGSGKDAILEYARASLGGRETFVFPRRCITRPSGPGEDHEPIARHEFLSAEDRGDFALTWRAHEVAYGIRGVVRDEVERGRTVVANVSREVVCELGRSFPRFAVVHVTVSPEVRLARILARGREDEAAARARIARPAPRVDADLEIVNDGTIAEAGATLVRFLDELALT